LITIAIKKSNKIKNLNKVLCEKHSKNKCCAATKNPYNVALQHQEDNLTSTNYFYIGDKP